MDRAATALLAFLCLTGCKDDQARQREAADQLAGDKAALECEQRFAQTSCQTAEYADQEACVIQRTQDHKDDNAKFFDAGAQYHGGCAERGIDSWPFTGRCQDLCTVFTGSAAANEPCDVDEGVLCQEGLVCSEEVCTPARNLVAAQDEPCAAGLNRVCADGLACGSNGRCALAPAVGQPCLLLSNDVPALCDTDHYCDDNGLCQQTRTLGQPCTAAEQCDTFSCVTGQCAGSSSEPTACWGLGTLYACAAPPQ